MPPIVSKLKGENVFIYTIHAQTDSLPSCSPLPFPSYCDVAEPRSCFASTVHVSLYMPLLSYLSMYCLFVIVLYFIVLVTL
jgi:hypothetical protein